MANPDPWIDAFRVAHDDIAAIARRLDAEGLARRSGATDWSVAQVLGHLGSASELGHKAFLATVEHRDPPDPADNPTVWDRWNSLDDAGKAAGYLKAAERAVEDFESLDPATRQSLRFDVGYLPEPINVSTAVAIRLNEFALHGWDVHVATDPDAALLPEPTDLLIDRSGMLIGFIGHADAIDGSVELRVETSSPDRVFGVSIGDRVSIGDPPTEPDAVLRLPAEAWLRLVAGRLTEVHTPPEVKVESDTITLHDLRRVFPGY